MSEKVQVATKKPEVKRENPTSHTRNADRSQSISSPVDQVLYLQRTIGNQAVQRLVSSGVLQAKLGIGQPRDKYEQEADRVAEAVMQMPEPQVQRQPEEEEQIKTKPVSEQITPLVQRQVEEEEEEELQTKTTSGNIPEVQPDIESHIHSLKGGGQPLSENDRAFFEPRFGDDFSQVRVHTDIRAAETAKSLKTRAFTVGRDIAFGAGQYAPESHEGRQLLAHELTHVVQQNDGVSAYIQRNNPRSVSNMTMQEKWSIVYEAAIYGSGDGMVMALAILLAFILIIALAAVILGIICPPCIATISAFLATTIWGASVAMWLTALLASIGVAVSIETMRSEYIIVNRAVGQAQTEDDLRRAGQRWGYNTGRELFNLIASIFAASSRIRTFVGNLARRLPGLRSAPRPTRAGGGRGTPPPSGPSPAATRARDLARQTRARGEPVIANMGGAGELHEPIGAININNQAVRRSGIPNLVEADASDIGQLFNAGSIDQVVGYHMAPDVINWQRAVPGIRSALRPGGTFRFDWRGGSSESVEVARLLREAGAGAGFREVRNISDTLVTAIRP